jgi:hypothetical protein
MTDRRSHDASVTNPLRLLARILARRVDGVHGGHVTLAAFIMPFTRSSLNALNLSSDARNLLSAASLAKMRAAASFSQAESVVNYRQRTFHVERFQKNPAAWIPEGNVRSLSPTVSFGFSSVTAAPPNTQPVIAQAPACLDAAGATMAGTACIVFNSRGVPVDATNAPTAADAYLRRRWIGGLRSDCVDRWNGPVVAHQCRQCQLGAQLGRHEFHSHSTSEREPGPRRQ